MSHNLGGNNERGRSNFNDPMNMNHAVYDSLVIETECCGQRPTDTFKDFDSSPITFWVQLKIPFFASPFEKRMSS